MKLTQLEKRDGDAVTLPPRGTLPPQAHVFDQASIDAVNAALAARRPLLVRGEPGTGKSQLARAAAAELGRPLVSEVIDSRTEARDLLWTFDAVARLAEAQLVGAMPEVKRVEQLREMLEPRRFVRPGPLWWTLNWASAREQAELLREPPPQKPDGWTPGQGCVLLIDEIDKGESDVPNGLLEALGEGVFRPPGLAEPVRFDGGLPPLVIVTTNEERALPDAFLRRCLVLHVSLPRLGPQPTKKEEDAFVAFLVGRAEAHFAPSRAGEEEQASLRAQAQREVFEQAARLLITDRVAALGRDLPPPGQAEYLDLLRAVIAQKPSAPKQQLALLETLASYVYQKHPEDDAQ